MKDKTIFSTRNYYNTNTFKILYIVNFRYLVFTNKKIITLNSYKLKSSISKQRIKIEISFLIYFEPYGNNYLLRGNSK